MRKTHKAPQKEPWTWPLVFFKQQSFGKQNLKVTEGGVVESAWIGVREIGFGPGFTRNAL